ncbi:MAG: signal transduction histidine kinase [Myxococcota bacterium]
MQVDSQSARRAFHINGWEGEARRRRLSQLSTIVALAWFCFAAQYAAQGRWVTVSLDIVVGIITGLVALWVRGPRLLWQLKLASGIVLGASALGLAIAALMSGQSRAMATWYLVGIPLFAAFDGGARSAIGWSIAAGALTILVHASEWVAVVQAEFIPVGSELLMGQIGLIGVTLTFALVFHRQAQQRLEVAAEVARRMRSLIDGLPDAVLLVNPTGRLLHANRRGLELVGAPDLDRLIGRTIQDALTTGLADSPGAIDWALRAVSELIDNGEAARGLELPLANGRLLEACYSPWTAGEESGHLLTFRDVSERADLDRMKGDLLTSVYDQVNGPLNALVGSLERLERADSADSKEERALFKHARTNTMKLHRMVQDLRDLRSSGSARQFPRVRVDVREALSEAASRMQHATLAAGVRIELTGPVGIEAIADRRRLVQVARHLLSNAIEFAPSGTPVEVRVVPGEDVVRIEVSDQGPGLEIDSLHDTFQAFRRVGSAGHRVSGPGLALASDLVERMGGRIGAMPRLRGGAVFWVELSKARAVRRLHA